MSTTLRPDPQHQNEPETAVTVMRSVDHPGTIALFVENGPRNETLARLTPNECRTLANALDWAAVEVRQSEADERRATREQRLQAAREEEA